VFLVREKPGLMVELLVYNLQMASVFVKWSLPALTHQFLAQAKETIRDLALMPEEHTEGFKRTVARLQAASYWIESRYELQQNGDSGVVPALTCLHKSLDTCHGNKSSPTCPLLWYESMYGDLAALSLVIGNTGDALQSYNLYLEAQKARSSADSDGLRDAIEYVAEELALVKTSTAAGLMPYADGLSLIDRDQGELWLTDQVLSSLRRKKGARNEDELTKALHFQCEAFTESATQQLMKESANANGTFFDWSELSGDYMDECCKCHQTKNILYPATPYIEELMDSHTMMGA
jgi:hypothetical protein